MINAEILKEIIEQYKIDFPISQWEDEKYKWQAIKCFQDNWNVDAEDFYTMLHNSLEKSSNLLVSANNFPRASIESLAKVAPEEVRAMFINLFDESKDFTERVADFKSKASILVPKYINSSVHHFQHENAISTYLWLRYPDKYYIYKYSGFKFIAGKLETNYKFSKGHYAENLRNAYKLYNEIWEKVLEDEELINIFRLKCDESCYADPKYKTLTMDIGFYITSKYNNSKSIPESKTNDTSIDVIKEPSEDYSDDVETIEAYPKYTKEDFLQEVFMSESRYERVKNVLLNKKNIILQGAPGVGKTFAAKRLAYAIMGEKDTSRIEFVQFHQNYSYEDFMMGYKPSGDGFELQYGIFYRFCERANADPDRDYFFIIDEINRGNMSKIFGELLMLIERDYRGSSATLAYNGQAFMVPPRLHIIGMMNTADRSLAMIDYALRRRFSFFEIEPGFDSEGFVNYQKTISNEIFPEIIAKIKELNGEITKDKSLGKGFCIGHSYFCGLEHGENEELLDIIDYDVVPMLNEYWFDDPEKIQRWENILHGVFQ